MYKCSLCKRNTGIIKLSKTKYGQYYSCRSCNTLRAKKYRKTKTGKKNIYKAVKKSTLKLYYKQLARVEMNACLQKGIIKKPLKCTICREVKKLEGHHEDYSKPLEVKWLCRGCHADLHNKLKIAIDKI